MQKQIIGYILGLNMLIQLVYSLTVSQGSLAGWCNIDPNPPVSTTDQTAFSAMDFDFASTFYTAEKESAPLYVKQGSFTTPFVFKTYSSDGTLQTERKCTGSEGYTYYSLVNDFLVLTKNDFIFYICKYLKDSDSVLIPLVSSTGYAVVDWTPFMANGSSLFVLYSTTSNSAVLNYTWTSAATSATPIPIGNQSASASPAMYSVVGSNTFLYNKATNAFVKLSGSSWIADTVLTSAVIGTQKIAAYPLRELRTVITLTADATKTSGSVYTVYQTTATLQLPLVTGSTIEIQDFTDNQHNFFRVHSDSLFWLTMRTIEYSFAFMTSTIATTETYLNLTGRGLTAANIFSVGMSQNKATIIYDLGWMDVLRHDASGNIKMLYSNPVTGNPVLSTNLNKQYSIKVSCICEAVKKHVCFSQTLNCAIISKMASSCAKSDTYTSW